MPRERKKTERIRQIYRWLVATHPTPYPTRLRLVRGKKRRSDQGVTTLSRRCLYIQIDIKYPLYSCIDTIIHEYAHAISWKHVSMEAHTPDHSDEWGLAMARLCRDFDDGGDVDSGNF